MPLTCQRPANDLLLGKLLPQPQSRCAVVAFIDGAIADYQQIASSIRDTAEVTLLDPHQDGVEQIASALSGRTDIAAIHVFSHGSPGHLYLGNAQLNVQTLDRVTRYDDWSPALAAIDLFLYGCNVAQGAAGAAFLAKLHMLTGANIAASANRTGNAALGGDWELEVRLGEIEAPDLLPEAITETYAGVFATITVTNTNDSGTGSLRAAVAAAQTGDTIAFASNLANQTITLTSEIVVAPGKTFTIDGAGAANLTISGGGTTRLFNVNSNQDFPINLTVQNLTLANAYTSGQGGAILVAHRGTVTVQNVTFNNNVADQGGGAIYNNFETTLTVLGSRFNNNRATAGNNERGAGAIGFFGPYTLTVRDSEFTGNLGINGAAINALNAQVTVDNSRFIDNDVRAAQVANGQQNPTLRGFGGAIYTDRANNSTTITNSVFEGNVSRAAGGALYLFNDPEDVVTISGSLFRGNQAIGLTGGQSGDGGAIEHVRNSLGSGSLAIQNSSLINNSAVAGQGGGLRVFNTNSTIVNSTFSGNSAPTNFGGAITTFGAPINLTNSTLAGNSAQFSGAIAAGSDNLATVRNTILANNTSANTGVSFNSNQQTNRPIINAGGNIQFPNGPAIATGITIADPQLGALQQVGNAVFYPLLAGSPAINAGASGAPTTDGRGATRDSQPDIGAYEFTGTQPSLAIDNVSLSEGNSGTTDAVFTVTLTGTNNQTVTVNYSTADSTATAGSDYNTVSGSLSFSGSQTTQTIRVPIIGDNLPESNETFFVNLTNPSNAILSNARGTGTILNDDAPPPTLSINNVSLIEGSSGTTDAVFTVTLTGTNSQTVTVNYSTANGTATTGADYNAVSGNLSFSGSQTTQTIRVAVVSDTLVESNETFFINLTNPSNATIATAQGTATITNDDFVGGRPAMPDFNGDGRVDFLWRNYATGQNAVWTMNNMTLSEGISIQSIPDTNWKIGGTGDFDGDGKTDFLWRHDITGQNAVWLMNGTTIKAGVFLQSIADTNWKMQGGGDFDGDGKADILWRNYATGQNAVWLMNGTTLKDGLFVQSIADTNWRMQGNGDFDGDGKADILWRNYATGQNAVWLMNSATLTGGVFLQSVSDTTWQMQGSGDFDSDGKADILWRNYGPSQNGATGVWYMNTVTSTSSPNQLLRETALTTAVRDNNWRVTI